MVWADPCRAGKPTASSVDVVGVTAAESAATPVLDAPPETSSGFVVATPENSSTSIATTVAVVTLTVTLVTLLALAAYQSSPSEKWPAAQYAPILVQVLPAGSVTLGIWFVAPV